MEKLRRINRDVSDLVLTKLQARDLLQMKCVSRAWRDLISDRSFAVHHSLHGHPPLLSGFLFQEKSRWVPHKVSAVSYVSTPKEEPPKLLKTPLDSIPENFAIASSCNGLICCKSFSPLSKGASIPLSKNTSATIHVGNVLTKEWVQVDWKGPLGTAVAMGLTFDPCSDLTGSSTNFKVVMVWQTEDSDGYSFHVYSSETKSWRLSDEMCDPGWYEVYDTKCVSVKGVVYWLTDGDKILLFDVEKEMSYSVSTPIPASEFDTEPVVACVGEADGKLQYVMVSMEGLLVWGLEDLYEGKWSLEYTKSLADMEKEHAEFSLNLQQVLRMQELKERWVDPLAFRDGILMLRVSNTVFSYNTRNGGMNRVAHVTEFGTESMFDSIVVPYSLSLAPLNLP
ncbi:unnamed protein product [Linum trigynum]|uniref:F-box domain-containing protein n=1 Tax=Linum trigynum TaxID=586398 RepID=A0AAV2FIB3_9ROSI